MIQFYLMEICVTQLNRIEDTILYNERNIDYNDIKHILKILIDW